MSGGCRVGNLNQLEAIILDAAPMPPSKSYGRGGATKNGRRRPKAKRNIETVADYEYDDEQGNVLYRIARREDGAGSKKFVAERPVGETGWKAGTKDIRRVLFRLPELLAADVDQPVYIVEGEKLVLRLMDAGLIATTNTGGAGKWKPDYTEHLKGRRVVLLPDNDDPGREHMQSVADSLYRVAEDVTIVDLPDLPDKGDVCDWLDAGGTVKELRKLVRATSPWRPSYAGVWASDIVPEDIKWLWKAHIPRGKFTLLAGDPGAGKSMITCDLVTRVTTGASWPDQDADAVSETRCGSALILSGEDGAADTVLPRLIRHGADVDRVLVVDVQRYTDYIMPEGLPHVEAAIQELRKRFPRRPVLAIIDPLEMFITCRNTNNSKEVRDSIGPLEALAARTGAAIVGILHLNKKSTEANVMYRFMGSMAFVASARVSMLADFDPSDMTTEVNSRRRVLAVNKINIGKVPASLTYQIVDPGKVRWGGESPYSANELMRQSAEPGAGAPKLEEAADFLRDELADGPVAANAIEAEADAARVKIATLRRAKTQLKVKSTWLPDKGYWEWSLPGKGEAIK